MEDKGGYKANEEESKWSWLWNSETKECLGRTGLSWFRITLFYIIFYACLAAFWTCMLVVFYQTLANDQPKWTLDASRIGSSPGLGFRPSPPQDNIDSTLIWFNSTRPETVNYWVDNLDSYLKPYEELSIGGNTIDCRNGQTATQDKVCLFDFKPVNATAEVCTLARQFGFTEKTPCVLIKLNRIYNWEPVSFTEAPQKLLDQLTEPFEQNLVYVTCAGENSADRDNIGKVNYFPKQGIPFNHFPFTNQKGYLSPFVFVHFNQINSGVLVNVECRAWAKNINFDRGDRLGSVHFELLVD